jgi:ubiquinone/menaquinone biosynthesis C-methylase UbiE
VESPRTQAAASPRVVAAALASVVNEVTRRTPAPRDFPYFGLDHPEGATADRLERLSELGIFRFYERVLDLAAGLGGPARWLARRHGCTVLSVDRSRARAAASRLLVRRAHLADAVAVGVAEFERLPVGDASFTHAWSVAGVDGETDARAIFAELFRVVRPGGHVALQEWSRSGEEPAREHVAALQAVGFGEVRVVSAGEPHEDDSTVVTLVRKRLAKRLEQSGAQAERVLDGSGRSIADGRWTLCQIFASRPA